MTTTAPQGPRTYGGWRRARGVGLFGAGPAGTAAVLAAVTGTLVVSSVSLRAGAVTALPATLIAAAAVTRIGGVSLAQLAVRRLRWTWGSARGWPSYRAPGPDLGEAAWDLPGVLAPTRLISVPDGRGRSFGIVWNRRTGHLTATIRCAASSTWLVDERDADGWVSTWHGWLAGLGYLPAVRSVAVTVDTAPEPGTTLRDTVAEQVSEHAPDDVRAWMAELVARSPAASADVDTRVSITFDPARMLPRPSHPQAAGTEIARLLTGLESALTGCGVTVLGRATALELAGIVRTAFDPAARGDVARLTSPTGPQALSAALRWADARPMATEEAWDSYRHDSGLSVSWGWQEAPRQPVTAGVLNRLLSPARYPKRVTLVYRPLPAGEAARVLEAQVNAAAFRDAYRRAQKRDESARDVADRAQAQRAAAEEARGAGVVLVSLYVTATVTDDAALPAAVADIEARADQSKLRLRRLYGGQAAGFAATLPAGLTGTLR